MLVALDPDVNGCSARLLIRLAWLVCERVSLWEGQGWGATLLVGLVDLRLLLQMHCLTYIVLVHEVVVEGERLPVLWVSILLADVKVALWVLVLLLGGVLILQLRVHGRRLLRRWPGSRASNLLWWLCSCVCVNVRWASLVPWIRVWCESILWLGFPGLLFLGIDIWVFVRLDWIFHGLLLSGHTWVCLALLCTSLGKGVVSFALAALPLMMSTVTSLRAILICGSSLLFVASTSPSLAVLPLHILAISASAVHSCSVSCVAATSNCWGGLFYLVDILLQSICYLGLMLVTLPLVAILARLNMLLWGLSIQPRLLARSLFLLSVVVAILGRRGRSLLFSKGRSIRDVVVDHLPLGTYSFDFARS